MKDYFENERAWYVVQTYSGCENAAKENILRRVESMGMQDYVFQALVPEVKIIETKRRVNKRSNYETISGLRFYRYDCY